jgi:hypothetical protein
LKKLSALLAEKWEKPCSQVCGCVNARVSVDIVGATLLTLLCLCGVCIPTSKMSRRLPQRWEDKAGLDLFRQQHLTVPTLPAQVPSF